MSLTTVQVNDYWPDSKDLKVTILFFGIVKYSRNFSCNSYAKTQRLLILAPWQRRLLPGLYVICIIGTDIEALCAIVIPSPIATTQWQRERRKTKELIERVLQQSEDIATSHYLVAISDEGVKYIVYSTLTEPGNEEQIRELGGEEGKCIVNYTNKRVIPQIVQDAWASWMNIFFSLFCENCEARGAIFICTSC